MTTYFPNFNDPRVMKRVLQAYGFTKACLSQEPRRWSRNIIRKHFGTNAVADLTIWLRNQLLICTDNHYSMDDHIPKEYIINKKGAKQLQQLLVEYYNLKGNKKQKVNLSELKLNSSPTHSLVDKKSTVQALQTQLDLFDKEVVLNFVRREYADELKTLDFKYDDKSNRLFNPLQNIKSDTRAQILAEAGLIHNYDIQACAPTLLTQWADMQPQATGEIRFAIEAYIRDRNKLRFHMMKACDINLKAAKTLINALFCGARLGANRDFALFHVLDASAHKVRLAQVDERLTYLRQDIKMMWQEIEPSLPRREKLNKNGKTRKLPLNSKIKWGVYFDLERRVLNVVNQYLKGRNNKVFLIHDGWVTQHPIDLTDLQQHIYEQTGFKVIIEKE